jgi:hypothetical protein
MGPVLFAAHDPGSANVILPLRRRLDRRGTPTASAGAGPAAAMLGTPPHRLGRSAADALLAAIAPVVLVTGAGASGFEQELWQAAHDRGIPSFAVVDVAFNLRGRFLDSGGAPAFPTAVGVVDQACAEELRGEAPGPHHIHVVGQPYFDDLAATATGPADGPPVFFSEPLRQLYGTEATDQYAMAAMAAAALVEAGEDRLCVRPHPTEGDDGWLDWRDADCPPRLKLSIDRGDSQALCRRARLVIGVTSAMLIEAALIGRPTLSVQIGRPPRFNRLVDDCPGVVVVRSGAALTCAIKALCGARPNAPPPRPEWATNAVSRAVAVIDGLAAASLNACSTSSVAASIDPTE